MVNLIRYFVLDLKDFTFVHKSLNKIYPAIVTTFLFRLICLRSE